MNSSNLLVKNELLYRPTYRRFKRSLAYTYEKRRWHEDNKADISNFDKFKLKAFCSFFTIFDTYAYEHFDYLVTGHDVITSLIITKILSDKGYRILLHPSYCEENSKEINDLINNQCLIRNDELYSYVESQLGFNHQSSSIADLVIALSKTIDKNKVLLTSGTRLAASNTWVSSYIGKQQVWPIGNRILKPIGMWNIVKKYIPKFSPYEGMPGYDKDKDPDYCITTIDNVIFTTRSSVGINKDIEKAKTFKFGDASKNIEDHMSYTTKNRIEDISIAVDWSKSVKEKDSDNV